MHTRTHQGVSSAGQPCRFTTLSATVSGLSPRTFYRFYIYAGNAAGLGLVSQPYPNAITTLQPAPRTLGLPPMVTNLVITAVTVSTVQLSWAPSTCTGTCLYTVKWTPATAGLSQVVGIRSTGYLHAVDFSKGSVGYAYRVFTGDNITNTYEDFGTEVYLPAAATGFKVTVATINSLSFTWTPDPRSDTFQVCARVAHVCVYACLFLALCTHFVCI